jgi:hydroxyacylglutathione hydrolase
MRLELVTSEGLAHTSYFLSDRGEALVIDPRRDCEIYTHLAERECAKIRYILETHRNEDYVIGSLELQNLTDAEIAHSRETPFRYGEHNLSDGDSFKVGRLKVEALHTPGHTDDSMCYVVYDPTTGSDPAMIFTGDTLFIGDVGRTDLVGIDVWREKSERLYESLHGKVLPLGDHVLVYPAHSAGSICGSHLSDREISSIGYEKNANFILQLEKEDFVEHMTGQKLLRPPYFRKMEEYNLNGAPLLHEAPEPRPLTVEEFEEEIHQPDAVIVDTREPGAFAGSHIPGSLSIWLDGVSFYPGWVLTYDQRILLVTERREDVEKAENYLRRIGFDNIAGHLCPGLGEWRDQGKPIDHLGTLSAATLKERLDLGEILLVDVREEREWEEGHIEGAENIYVGHLKEEADRLPRDRPIATTCGWGGRGSLGASILKRLGFEEVCNVLGGMRAWGRLGYLLKTK